MVRTATNQVADSGRVPLLDLLRFLAIVGVMLFHYGFLGPPGIGTRGVALPWMAPVARYGYLGVPIFFIISGFVIAYSAQGRTWSGFAIARIARIYPTFIFCMTITWAMTLLFGAPTFATSIQQWIANLFIAAPAFRQPYIDLAYWSLVLEVSFYGWVAALMALKAFPRHIDMIVLVWLCVSLANELTIDAVWIEKAMLTDYSGFFATGLVIFELYKGRRDLVVQALLAFSTGTAVFQAIHNLAYLRYHTDTAFDSLIVASICIASVLIVMWCTRVQRSLVPASILMAIGGITYPFYLLHQQVGYDLLNRLGQQHSELFVFSILLGILFASWFIWRYLERPAQRFTKDSLTTMAARIKLDALTFNNLVRSRPARRL